MKELNTVLRQVVVKQFYYRNAGFFLVSFFLLFGVQQPATFLVSPFFLSGVAASPFFTGLVLAVLFLYYLKCLHFFHKTLSQPENEFLYIGALLPQKELLKGLAKAYLLIFLPAVVYSGWLVVVGAATGGLWPLLLVPLYHLLLLLGAISSLKAKVCGFASGRTYRFIRFPALPWPPFLWPLRFLLHQERMMLVLTKAASLAVLSGFMLLYPYPQYDLRPTQTGFLVGLALQALLVRRIQEFLERELGVHRALPFPLLYRVGQQALLFLVLLVPEVFCLYRLSGSSEGTFLPFAELWLFGGGFLLLLHSLLYKPRFQQETYLRQVFFLFIGLLLTFLFAPAVWLLALGFTGVALFLYRRWYYQYEPEVRESAQEEVGSGR